VLNVGGFNLDRALEVDPKFLDPEYPFAWTGIYRLEAGAYELVLHDGPDESMNIWLTEVQDARFDCLESVELDAVIALSDTESHGRNMKPVWKVVLLICTVGFTAALIERRSHPAAGKAVGSET
jgi:hypothetical protein